MACQEAIKPNTSKINLEGESTIKNTSLDKQKKFKYHLNFRSLSTLSINPPHVSLAVLLASL